MNLPNNLSLDEWVRYVFDHEVDKSKPEWYWDIDADHWNELENPVQTVEYLTHAFENIDVIAQSYSDAQIEQAMWFVVSNGGSSHMFAPMDEKVSPKQRERFAASIVELYRKLYLPKCTPHLGHSRRVVPDDMNPLNMSCYMWWDIAPLPGRPGDQMWDRTLLNVLGQILELDSDACRESALHGLGHWHMHYPKEVEQIIDKFLAEHQNLRPELITYAKSARTGCVL